MNVTFTILRIIASSNLPALSRPPEEFKKPGLQCSGTGCDNGCVAWVVNHRYVKNEFYGGNFMQTRVQLRGKRLNCRYRKLVLWIRRTTAGIKAQSFLIPFSGCRAIARWSLPVVNSYFFRKSGSGWKALRNRVPDSQHNQHRNQISYKGFFKKADEKHPVNVGLQFPGAGRNHAQNFGGM